MEEIKDIIETNSNIEVAGTFENGIDVLNYINKNIDKIDVIFLDINIPLLNGVELARTIRNFENQPKIVFITAYEKYAVEAFELEAFDYIMKPFSEERIIAMLDKLEKNYNKEIILKEVMPSEILQRTERKIKLKEKNGYVVLDENDIFMCMADDKETYVYTNDKKYTILDCISDIYNELPKDKFFKCHRSYIVNLSKITEIIPTGNSTYKLVLENEDLECWVSRSNIKSFREIIKRY